MCVGVVRCGVRETEGIRDIADTMHGARFGTTGRGSRLARSLADLPYVRVPRVLVDTKGGGTIAKGHEEKGFHRAMCGISKESRASKLEPELRWRILGFWMSCLWFMVYDLFVFF